MKAKEILIHNGKIWRSGLSSYDWFTFNVDTGRITGIGHNPPPNNEDFKDSIDARSSRIFPGLHDSHIHVAGTGLFSASPNLIGCSSIEDLQKRIKEFANKKQHQSWITGYGWDQDVLGRYPDKQDLDAVCPDRPVVFSHVCGHTIAVNSLGLKVAGITKDTPNPDGGVIEHYPQGQKLEHEPTGILKEKAASLVKCHMVFSKEEKKAHIKAGLQMCLQNGLTSVHSNEYDDDQETLWNEYCELAQENQLPIRVFMAAYYSGKKTGNFPSYPGAKCGQLLSCDRVKIFADGSLGDCTAALSKDYKDQPGNCGVLRHSQESLNQMVRDATNEGFRLEMHVIGDRAVEAALNALEEAHVSPEKRPILTHCQIPREDLSDRMVKQGVIANIQPQFVTSDARLVPEKLPEELLHMSYAWKTLLQKGILCAGGSDSPIESPEPFIGMYDAIFRPNGERVADNQDSFRPEECLTVTEAIDLYTKAGAYTAMREHDLGQLLPGYMADFVILEGSCDPVEDPKYFLKAKAAQVWVAGKRML